MMYPSTYGEPFVSCEERVMRYIERNGKTRVDTLLTDLSRGFDTYRSDYFHAASELVAEGLLVVVHDPYGYAYYVAA